VAAGAISLRPARPADQEFLHTVYGSTRVDELAVVPWTDDEKTAFLDMQFAAQDVGYRQAYPDGEWLVIELDGRPIGRMILARLDDELRLVDIALLSEHRGAGIGGGLIRSVMDEAAGSGLAVRLHVEPWNRALRLYERLGFRRLEERGMHVLLEWRSDGVPTDARAPKSGR
jgi:ribosomal protein S18 acetylase RimI-like enzyme